MIKITAVSYENNEQTTVLEIDDDSYKEIYPHMFSKDVYLTIEYVKDTKEKK